MTDKIDASPAAIAAPSFTFEAPYDACVRTGLYGQYIALHLAGELIATFSFTEWGGEQGAIQAAWRFAYHVETCTECEAPAAERDRLAAQLAEARAEGWRRGIEAAADVCTAVIRDYRIMKKDGVTYETARVHHVAHGLVSVAREDIRALPMPADLEAPV